MKHHLLRWLLLAVLALPVTQPVHAIEGKSSTAGTTSLPSDIPLRRDAADADTGSGRAVFVIWSVLALGALVWIAIGWSRRHQHRGVEAGTPLTGDWKSDITKVFGRAANADLRVLGSARIGARNSVHVVAWQQKEYLLGSSEQGLTLLDQRQSPVSVSPSEPSTR